MTSPPAPRLLRALSVKDLVTQATPQLAGLFPALEAGHSIGDAKMAYTADELSHLLKNKARLFKEGLGYLQEYVDPRKGSPNLPNKTIQVFTHDTQIVSTTPLTLRTVPQTQTTRNWMNYQQTDASFWTVYVDFSNAVLGGAWDGVGNVQEEQMVLSCPELACLLSLTNKNSQPWQAEALKTRTQSNVGGKGTPLLLTSLQCFTQLPERVAKGNLVSDLKPHEDLYGAHFDVTLCTPRKSPRHYPHIQILAMAAPNVSNQKDQQYTQALLDDLFQNAFAGFQMAKQKAQEASKPLHLVTGMWGAGVFGHHFHLSIATQYAAALAAGFDQHDKITWTGIPGRHLSEVAEIEKSIQQYFGYYRASLNPTTWKSPPPRPAQSPRSFLDTLFSKVAHDPKYVLGKKLGNDRIVFPTL